MSKVRRTEEHILSVVSTFWESGLSMREFCSVNEIPKTSLSRWLKRPSALNDKGKKGESSVINHTQIEFPLLPSNKINVLSELQDLADRTKKSQSTEKDYAKIAIKAGHPIAVMKGSDFHLGGLDVSYDSLLNHYKFLLEEPGFYLQLFGDDINLMVMHKTVGARHDILSPLQQGNLLSSMVDELVERNKLISMCWGNHSDEFTERNSGFSLTKLLVAHKIPYFRGMGYIDLVVGDQTYPQAFTHKTRFHSFMNAVHGNKRMEQMHAEFFGPSRPIAREYITAHTHYPAYSVEGNIPEDRIWYVKTGTFKNDCLYSQRYFGQGRIGVPTMVYFPDRFEHICFPTPFDAYRYMTGKDWPGLKNSEKK